MTEVLQSHIPYRIPDRMPGTAPLAPEHWILVDDAFAGQMALRDVLIAERREEVIRLAPEALPAALELFHKVMTAIAQRSDYHVSDGIVRRPDGVIVPLEPGDPLGTVGRLVQQDFCLMQKRMGEAEHRLSGAVLCFPAQWRLAEKFLRPMRAIHEPVREYDDNLAKRVQRLLDGVRPGHPIWRANALLRSHADLFTHTRGDGPPAYLRSERQSLLRLPETGVVAFGIHTFIVPLAAAQGVAKVDAVMSGPV